MPLSDHEQQLLRELEEKLRSEDPRFVRTISSSDRSGSGMAAKSIVVGLLIGALGLAMVVGAVLFLGGPAQIAVGLIGFGIMVYGAYRPYSAAGRASETSSAQPGKAKKKPARASFMDRLEERWNDRRHGGE